MMKNRIMWLLWLIGMAGATVVTGSWLMAAVLLLSALLLLLSAAVTSLGGRKTEIKLSVPRAAERNENFRGRMTLKNQSAWPVFGGRGEILWENLFTGEHGEIPIAFSLGSREKRTIEFEACSGWCGCIKVTFSDWRCSDFFHVFYVKRKAVAEGATVIMPEKQNRDFSFLTREGFDMESFRYSGNRPGDDPGETYDIREYQPGDSIRQIHWKLSSKLNHILIKEASLPVSRSLLVFWDKNTEEASPDEMDAMAESVSSICQALSQDGVQYTLGWTDGQEICQEEAFTLEELLRLLPQMLKNGQNPVEDGVSLWMDAYGRAEYGKIIYFAKRIPESLEEFSGGEISILLCDGIPADNRWNTMVYHAQTFAEDLQMVVL